MSRSKPLQYDLMDVWWQKMHSVGTGSRTMQVVGNGTGKQTSHLPGHLTIFHKVCTVRSGCGAWISRPKVVDVGQRRMAVRSYGTLAAAAGREGMQGENCLIAVLGIVSTPPCWSCFMMELLLLLMDHSWTVRQEGHKGV